MMIFRYKSRISYLKSISKPRRETYSQLKGMYYGVFQA